MRQHSAFSLLQSPSSPLPPPPPPPSPHRARTSVAMCITSLNVTIASHLCCERWEKAERESAEVSTVHSVSAQTYNPCTLQRSLRASTDGWFWKYVYAYFRTSHKSSSHVRVKVRENMEQVRHACLLRLRSTFRLCLRPGLIRSEVWWLVLPPKQMACFSVGDATSHR